MMGETVGQRVARVIATAAVLVLLVGSVGVIGLFVTTRSVDNLVDHIEPAREANDGVLQDLTDADAGIRGWAISGDQAALVPFFDAMDELPDHQSDLERFQPPIDGLDALLESQDQAIDAWVTAYANPRLDAGSVRRTTTRRWSSAAAGRSSPAAPSSPSSTCVTSCSWWSSTSGWSRPAATSPWRWSSRPSRCGCSRTRPRS